MKSHTGKEMFNILCHLFGRIQWDSETPRLLSVSLGVLILAGLKQCHLGSHLTSALAP